MDRFTTLRWSFSNSDYFQCISSQKSHRKYMAELFESQAKNGPLFPGRAAGSYKWQCLFCWQLVLHNSTGAEKQNTHWPYLLPSYRGWNMVGDITKHKLEMFLEAWAIILWPACLISLQITFLFPFSHGLIAEINGLDSWTIWFNQAILSSEWNKRAYFIQAHGNWSLHYLKKIEGFEISSKSTKWWKAYLFPIQK